MVSSLKWIVRKGRPGPEVCVYGNSPRAKTNTHAPKGMRLNVGLRPNRAHLLLEVPEELVECYLHRPFDNDVRGSCNLPLHLGMCIIDKIGVCGIAGQIYYARGFD